MNNSPGRNLREVRESLHLKYRDVEEASLLVASRNHNAEFVIGLSRLADIENKGTVPSIYRMYSLAVIYGLDYSEVLLLYGISLSNSAADVAGLQLQVTRPVSVYVPRQSTAEVPLRFITSTDLRRTVFLNRQVSDWGLLPLQLLGSLNSSRHKYAMVGTEDWSMYPLIPPGSFVQIDESKRKVSNGGWDNDFTRPIYLFELRQGYRFGWCTEHAGTLIVQPHSSAPVPAEAYRYPGEIEILGQVVGLAMRLDRGKQRRKRSSSSQG